LRKELEELIPKNISDWQIVLGKVFNFKPTEFTTRFKTVEEYLNKMEASGKRLSAAMGR
jgi:hypothetical protein